MIVKAERASRLSTGVSYGCHASENAKSRLRIVVAVSRELLAKAGLDHDSPYRFWFDPESRQGGLVPAKSGQRLTMNGASLRLFGNWFKGMPFCNGSIPVECIRAANDGVVFAFPESVSFGADSCA